jgi:hypothetical protein
MSKSKEEETEVSLLHRKRSPSRKSDELSIRFCVTIDERKNNTSKEGMEDEEIKRGE